LVLPMIGRENALLRGALHLILKEIFAMAAERLRASGPQWEAQAAVLAGASAHWLRHTAGSHMTDQQVDCVSCATTSAMRLNRGAVWQGVKPCSGDEPLFSTRLISFRPQESTARRREWSLLLRSPSYR